MKKSDLENLYTLSFDEAEEKVVEKAANIRMTLSLNYNQCLEQTAVHLGFGSFVDLHKNLKDNCLEADPVS